MWTRLRERRDGREPVSLRALVPACLLAIVGSILSGCGQHTASGAPERLLALAPDAAPPGNASDASTPRTCGDVIPYVVDANRAPSGALSDLRRAFARVTEATGIEFAYGGASQAPARPPARAEVATGATRLPRRILVAWVGPEHLDAFAPSPEAAGWGYGVWQKTRSGIRFVSGGVYLNAAHSRRNGFDDRADWGGVLLHELGHVMGLDHSADPQDLMFEKVGNGAAEWGPTDRELLRQRAVRADCEAPKRHAETAT